ncbi:MAG: radical SAM protein [Pseudomonadota bacterium]
MLLISPPAVKACEPPPGVARLAGVLRGSGVSCRVVDANLDGQRWLLARSEVPDDTFTRRALRHRERNLALVSSWAGYRGAAAYRQAVTALNRLMTAAPSATGAFAGLSNYSDPVLQPFHSADLCRAAEQPEASPFAGYFEALIDAECIHRSPDIVGISVGFQSQALSAFHLIGALRRRLPAVRIILGGGLVTSWLRAGSGAPDFTGLVDDLVAGPGEAFLLNLAGVDPAAAVLPDYSDFLPGRYFSPGPIVPYSTADGCFWRRCRFCPERAEASLWRPAPLGIAVSELAALVQRHRPALIHLVDNALRPALLERLCLDPPGAPWYGFVRFDQRLAEPDTAAALRRSGCVMLKLGLESGDQGVLDAMDKGLRLETASRVLTTLHRAGIATYVYVLFGTPSEDETAARRTLAFVRAHAASVDYLNVAVFNLPAGSPDAVTLETRPFSAADLGCYRDFVHPLGWHRRNVRRFVDGVFRKDPAIAAILRRAPPFFTSNHAPLFALARTM